MGPVGLVDLAVQTALPMKNKPTPIPEGGRMPAIRYNRCVSMVHKIIGTAHIELRNVHYDSGDRKKKSEPGNIAVTGLFGRFILLPPQKGHQPGDLGFEKINRAQAAGHGQLQ